MLAAGNLNTQRLLFASVGGPTGLQPMPSLGRCFGANGDLMGFWFREKVSPSMFDSGAVLGQFEVDGEASPSLVLAGLPGVDTLPMPAFLKRKLADTVMLLGMDPDSGGGAVSYRRGRLRVRYDHREEPAYGRIRQAFHALEEDERGSSTWSLTTPLRCIPGAVHASARTVTMASSIIVARSTAIRACSSPTVLHCLLRRERRRRYRLPHGHITWASISRSVPADNETAC